MPLSRLILILLALLLTACTTTGKGKPESVVAPQPVIPAAPSAVPLPQPGVVPAPRDVDVEDVRRIPQNFQNLPALASAPSITDQSAKRLAAGFLRRFFQPWSQSAPIFPPAEAKRNMARKVSGNWIGVNRRKMPRKLLEDIVKNCALESFPSQSEMAIAVAPAHLREIPTQLPLYTKSEGPPFDQIAYPQVKLNEPLRVLHVSRDGAWLFVESPYSEGWLQRRDVALVDDVFVKQWMEGPHLVLIRDQAAVPDGRGIGTYQCKVGTVLPLCGREERWWEIAVASAGDGGRAVKAVARIPIDAAAPFPLCFNSVNLALIGDQLLGDPYGWGEIFGLRDCSALLRDFFMPFGIWLPRTAIEQIGAVPERIKLASLTPPEKEALIKEKGIPFLTLLYKPGHIMLYVGTDRDGDPLAFHGSWSIKVKDQGVERAQIIGVSAITTLHPGRELGLVPGTSLLDRVTEMGIIGLPSP